MGLEVVAPTGPQQHCARGGPRHRARRQLQGLALGLREPAEARGLIFSFPV